MKQRILFIWTYLTNASFRNYVDMNAAQKFVNDIRRQFEEKQRYEFHKIYGEDHPYPPDLTP